ncbi:FAD-binding protein [Desulfovibrio aerotolerans]|uniref:FAD-binding protein n=1 Tax=Solidesulfovibrio aerotolerans TaxID=295255 RepID=A0A7C9IWW7_9BACT|nr:FAD-binding oxidoreductase [Solidesulfovibrio aerotolerans]MYL85203.1 FAD-binding protein [Solidesulfovibrio aerotolerans]
MHLMDWGNYPVVDTTLLRPRTIDAATEVVTRAEHLIARGLGRCYGDTALNASLVVSAEKLDEMLDFDPSTGLLVAQAGVSLAEILDAFAPRGWFLPVTPGTKFVTLGGAIASDVHGKNHHLAETIGRHIAWCDVLTAEQGVLRCSPTEHPELFHATCGGMGLTGVILRAAIRLVRVPSVWIRQQGYKARNLEEIMDAFDTYAQAPFTVAWIDCLKRGPAMGRSFLMAGDWADPDSLPGKQRGRPFAVPAVRERNVPIPFPSVVLNPLSVRAFNALYYAKAPRGTSESIVSYNAFFYPLDAVHNWNRIYGKRGFTQYQFAIPREAAKEGLPQILDRIAASGQGSFLAVLKLFGKQTTFPGNISFPMEGYTLALDFPITRALFPVLDELDAMVLDYGGRLYLTKDARMSAATVRRGYGKALDAFLEVKSRYDPHNKFRSLQSQRLGLGGAAFLLHNDHAVAAL